MLREGADFDFAAVQAGLRDALAEDTRLTEEERTQAIQEFSAAFREQAQQRAAEAASSNLTEGAAFLEENGARNGVTTTASGLQYEVITEGNGARPTASR